MCARPKIETFVTDSSVNRIQDGLDEICELWNLDSVGSKRVAKGEACKASVINDWLYWLDSYRGIIGVGRNDIIEVNEVEPGTIMRIKTIDDIYDNTQTVKNWCNRTECNEYECNEYECNNYECNDAECDDYECDDAECNYTECDDGECNYTECNEPECNGSSECNDAECDNMECDDSECDNSECDGSECDDSEY